ncbi:hypothetical protein BZG36_05428 [Bifiguratus adelaidae]|uniref:Uncharacterized protein n=1 Tax=Bifiguratus adelaidae TaxID=1938954 RepID=A0A261XTM8_9FUNG|nr:hypothetical protein BZG36_05428 [Bifiguratus adelaidae]
MGLYVFASINVVTAVGTNRYVKETKGVPLEEMDEVFGGVNRITEQEMKDAEEGIVAESVVAMGVVTVVCGLVYRQDFLVHLLPGIYWSHVAWYATLTVLCVWGIAFTVQRQVTSLSGIKLFVGFLWVWFAVNVCLEVLNLTLLTLDQSRIESQCMGEEIEDLNADITSDPQDQCHIEWQKLLVTYGVGFAVFTVIELYFALVITFYKNSLINSVRLQLYTSQKDWGAGPSMSQIMLDDREEGLDESVNEHNRDRGMNIDHDAKSPLVSASDKDELSRRAWS